MKDDLGLHIYKKYLASYLGISLPPSQCISMLALINDLQREDHEAAKLAAELVHPGRVTDCPINPRRRCLPREAALSPVP